MPDSAVAHALGRFDWGVPIGGIPNFTSTVPRVVQLDEISAALSRDADGRQTRAAVLTGTTGNGKSALAADFCHLHYNAFEFMCWIDCRERDTMIADVRRYTEDLTGTRLGHKPDPTNIFHNALARHRGPWLLVFDGAPSRQAIEALIPKHGNGNVVITTPNETSWWPTVPKIQIPTFSPDEAVKCFATYAGLDPSTEHPGVRTSPSWMPSKTRAPYHPESAMPRSTRRFDMPSATSAMDSDPTRPTRCGSRKR
jgi:hypothetical protein